MTTIDLLKELNSITKIKIICWLLKKTEGLTVTQLVDLVPSKRENISKQICELNKKEIVIRKKLGKNNIYLLNNSLEELNLQLIKLIVNSYHIIDEKKGDNYESYR